MLGAVLRIIGDILALIGIALVAAAAVLGSMVIIAGWQQ